MKTTRQLLSEVHAELLAFRVQRLFYYGGMCSLADSLFGIHSRNALRFKAHIHIHKHQPTARSRSCPEPIRQAAARHQRLSPHDTDAYFFDPYDLEIRIAFLEWLIEREDKR